MRANLLVVDGLVRRLTYRLHVVLDFGIKWLLLFLAYSIDLAIHHLAALCHHSMILAFYILLLDELLLFIEELLLKRLALLFLRILDLHAR